MNLDNVWPLIGLAAVGAVVWWIFKPSKSTSGPASGSDGSAMRLAEAGLTAASQGLKVSVEDASLVDRWDFPPFGRGEARRATEVLKGLIDGEEVLAFHYSFELPGEARRREFDITVLPAHFDWQGRLRVAAKPRDPGTTPSFDEAFRVDERPIAELDPLTPRAQAILLERDFMSSAVVASPREILLIDGQAREFQELTDVVSHIRRLRAAFAAK